MAFIKIRDLAILFELEVGMELITALQDEFLRELPAALYFSNNPNLTLGSFLEET